MIELSITIKNEDQTLTQKHLIYDPITFSNGSPDLQPLVDEATLNFKGDKGDVDIIVKAKMVW